MLKIHPVKSVFSKGEKFSLKAHIIIKSKITKKMTKSIRLKYKISKKMNNKLHFSVKVSMLHLLQGIILPNLVRKEGKVPIVRP